MQYTQTSEFSSPTVEDEPRSIPQLERVKYGSSIGGGEGGREKGCRKGVFRREESVIS
jgi:hypothetical protein